MAKTSKSEACMIQDFLKETHRILTEDMVYCAFDLAAPSIATILVQEGATWGPKYVRMLVKGPGLNGMPLRTIGREEPWKKEWGEAKDFGAIALEKIRISQDTGLPSGVVLYQRPWLFGLNNFLYRGSWTEDGKLIVATSGACGETDEACSRIVHDIIAMLCQLKVVKMKKDGIKQLLYKRR